MGSSSSKAASAAGSAARKYPSRPAPPTSSTTNARSSQPPPAARGKPGPTVHPQAQASSGRSEGAFILLSPLQSLFPNRQLATAVTQANPSQPSTSTPQTPTLPPPSANSAPSNQTPPSPPPPHSSLQIPDPIPWRQTRARTRPSWYWTHDQDCRMKRKESFLMRERGAMPDGSFWMWAL